MVLLLMLVVHVRVGVGRQGGLPRGLRLRPLMRLRRVVVVLLLLLLLRVMLLVVVPQTAFVDTAMTCGKIDGGRRRRLGT